MMESKTRKRDDARAALTILGVLLLVACGAAIAVRLLLGT